MALKKSEKTLVILTVIAMVCFVAYRMGAGRISTVSLGRLYVTERALEKEAEKVDRVKIALEKYHPLTERYTGMVNNLIKSEENKTAEAQFSEYMADLLKKMNLSASANIEVPYLEWIPDMEDYKYVVLTVSIADQQEWAQVVQLLRDFEKNKLLLKDLTVNHSWSKSTFRVDLTLAQIAPTTEADREVIAAENRKNRKR